MISRASFIHPRVGDQQALCVETWLICMTVDKEQAVRSNALLYAITFTTSFKHGDIYYPLAYSGLTMILHPPISTQHDYEPIIMVP